MSGATPRFSSDVRVLLQVTLGQCQQVAQLERFGDEGDKPFTFDGTLAKVGNIRRTEYRTNGRVHLLELSQRFETVHVGHEHVEDDQVDLVAQFGVDVDGPGAALGRTRLPRRGAGLSPRARPFADIVRPKRAEWDRPGDGGSRIGRGLRGAVGPRGNRAPR